MNARKNWNVGAVCLVVALAALASSAPANLLVDPGFEANPLDNLVTVLNNYPVYQGVWGVEAATIVGAEAGITPPEGVKMLRMVDDFITYTQGVQVTDVTSYAALIDAGGATFNLSALFNSNTPGALGSVSLIFCTTNTWASQTGSLGSGNFPVDGSANTWESVSVNGVLPVGTRWLVSQVAYEDASLKGLPGYVDAAELLVTPEPGSIALLTLGAAAMRLRRR